MKPPVIILANQSPEEMGANGNYIYTDDDNLNPLIVISKGSNNITTTFFHECIHHTILEMKANPELKKLAYRIYKREDFVNALAENLSKYITLELNPRYIKEKIK